jgi:TetR/AcrR family transcriptional regulator
MADMRRMESQQRRQILDASVGVFAQHGLKGATTRLIGKAAGVNSALIYYYFENKEMLFGEVVRLVLGEFLSLLEGRRLPLAGSRPRIQFLVDGFFEYFISHPDRARLMTRVLAFHGKLTAEAIQIFAREQRRLVPLEVIADGVKRGELRPVSPIQAWWSILGICLFALHIREMSSHLDPA